MLNDHHDYENQQFTQLNIEKHAFKGIYFEECRFIDCQFSETSFEQCQFHECVFHNCDLSLTRWQGSSFQNGRFYQSKLIGINWTRLNWSKFVKESPLLFEGCSLDYSTFLGLNIQKQIMSDCSLKDVDFTEADLTGANFSGSNLTGAQFRHSKLMKANFEKATGYAINPQINSLKQAQFSLPEAINLLESMDIILLET